MLSRIRHRAARADLHEPEPVLSKPIIQEAPRSRAHGARARMIGLFVLGCALSALCYGLTIRAGLGLGPLYSAQDGLARHLGISIGTAVMLVGVGFLVLALCLRSWPGPGTIVQPFLAGELLNLLLPHLPVIHGWALRTVTVLGATWFMALGGSLMIHAALGPSSYDLTMLGLRQRTGRSIVVIRLCMEATMLVSGWLLGGAIGLGTVITGVLIAPGMQFWLRILGDPRARRSDPAPLTRRTERIEIR
jgi:uncharacterized membrane protein YczE